jgi:hypothetical protein
MAKEETKRAILSTDGLGRGNGGYNKSEELLMMKKPGTIDKTTEAWGLEGLARLVGGGVGCFKFAVIVNIHLLRLLLHMIHVTKVRAWKCRSVFRSVC